VGFQFPENQFYLNTLIEDLTVGLIEQGDSIEEAEKQADIALKKVNLNPDIFRNRNHLTLSGGERRRAAIATLICLNPDIYIFDEPTAGLDGFEIKNIGIIFTNLSEQGKTIIAISQDSSFISELCDRLIVLDQGSLSFDGSVVDFFTDSDLASKLGIEQPPIIGLLNKMKRKTSDFISSNLKLENVIEEYTLHIQSNTHGNMV